MTWVHIDKASHFQGFLLPFPIPFSWLSMRFYRFFFWVASIIHLLLAAWLCLTPELALVQLGHESTVPLIYLQEHGLFLFIQACAFAYVAERPSKSIPVVSLATLVNLCLPLFALSAASRNEISSLHLSFQLWEAGLMLPFLASYFVWFYHVPRPDRFMPLMGIFGDSSKK
jgi:hypothetical protein